MQRYQWMRAVCCDDVRELICSRVDVRATIPVMWCGRTVCPREQHVGSIRWRVVHNAVQRVLLVGRRRQRNLVPRIRIAFVAERGSRTHLGDSTERGALLLLRSRTCPVFHSPKNLTNKRNNATISLSVTYACARTGHHFSSSA